MNFPKYCTISHIYFWKQKLPHWIAENFHVENRGITLQTYYEKNGEQTATFLAVHFTFFDGTFYYSLVYTLYSQEQIIPQMKGRKFFCGHLFILRSILSIRYYFQWKLVWQKNSYWSDYRTALILKKTWKLKFNVNP